ncbi:hypothetical protein JW916_16355 [Candidatus Sumerlaeota bacterium]|nr:hypothetical protein [Candidatus Sumerlaeota bacterium]
MPELPSPSSRGGKPLDFSDIKTYSVRDRPSKVDPSQIARIPEIHKPLEQFFDCLPRILKAKDLLELAEHIVVAAAGGRKVLWMMGAHVIKCGLSPLIIKLMEQRIVHGVAMNGAGAIHDFELACFGHTSEDVEKGLADGSFGMARETGEWMNELINDGVQRGFGIGYSLGRGILDRQPRFLEFSILAHAVGLRVPITIHVAIGTDIIHQHPSTDPAMLGKGSYKDFQIFAGELPGLHEGGVIVNCGSAVILPEVFLKALTVARNLGNPIQRFVAANFDMIQHYRPNANVLARPTQDGGKAYSFTGHHEIMIPLLYAAIQRLLR